MTAQSSNQRVFILAALVAVTMAAVLYLGWERRPQSPPPETKPTPAPTPSTVVTPQASGPTKPTDSAPPVRTSPDHSPLADLLNAPDNTPQRDLEILKDILGQFTSSLKPGIAPPLGDNQDITAALTGHNKLHIVFIPPNHPAIDDKGRLLDRWGTPYFFHARTAETFDLRSAGPDKVLFTPDDIVRAWK